MSGEQLKLRGIQKVEKRNHAWINRSIEIIQGMASGELLCIDDLRGKLFSLPSHHNAFGALMSAASKRGLVKRISYEKSRRPEAHSRMVATWIRN